MRRRRVLGLAAWLTLTTASSAYLGLSLDGRDRRLFLPGDTTSGHHQLEDRCEACHEPGRGVREDACLGCHQDELAQADDSHPRRKFLDPRNAALRGAIDGRRCVSCHVEHRPADTGPMGVSRADDLCAACHADVGERRASHAGRPFGGPRGCQSVGCHNYHDNRALGARFLAEHQGDPALRDGATVPALTRAPRRYGPALGIADADAPAGLAAARDPVAIGEWLGSAHALAGVNCSGCHGGVDGGDRWTARPGPAACRGCHADEVAGFTSGKHGMRHAVGLPAMRPEDARLPMRPDAAHREVGCASCHGAHAVDRRRAAVDACLGCHADRHSAAYASSPHGRAFAADAALDDADVTCATCHLPRVRRADSARPGVAVEHDQNAALRPVEAMVWPVCLRCHGLDLALAALADPALIERNFDRAPTGSAEALEMIRRQRAAAPRPAIPEERP